MNSEHLLEIIIKELERRKSRNSAYSLRSFAQSLEMDASNLQKILSKRKNLGPKLAADIAKKIGFTEDDFRSIPQTSDDNYARHDLASFEVVSAPHHYAILELFKITNFKPTPKNIAKRLGISPKESDESVQRLLRVGLLKTSETGTLEPTDESSSSILNTVTSKAHRDQQAAILETAISAVQNVPIELRSQSSMTMAIDTQNLDKARALIKKFRREMGRLLSDSDDLDSVYQLSVSLFPLSKID
ncbi:MAG: TIGR02147 family protein [Proteobacteria bacterium]|nr:MAG: TIGR02147 family protein [Pseudomonadota bacterium]